MQEAFYDASGVQQLVLKALDGYSATVFAYGQTGSGKTYSVSGAEHVIVDEGYHGGDTREGLVPRAARQICEAMAQRNDVQGHNAYALKAACFEIYNEQVIDLVNPEAGPLQIRESRSQGFFIENLLVVDCAEVAELMEVFKEGTRNRKVGAHALNRDSSRSHSALVLYVDRTTLVRARRPTSRLNPEPWCTRRRRLSDRRLPRCAGPGDGGRSEAVRQDHVCGPGGLRAAQILGELRRDAQGDGEAR